MKKENNQNKLVSFQLAAIDAIGLALDQEKRRILVQLPGGIGRNAIIESLLGSDRFDNSSVLILVQSTVEKMQLLEVLGLSTTRPTAIKSLPTINIAIRGIDVLTLKEFREVSDKSVKATNCDLLLSLGFSLDPELKLLLSINQVDSDSRLTIISFVSSATPIDLENYGEPVFSYSMHDAVNDKVLLPLQLHACAKLEAEDLTANDRLTTALTPFVSHFAATSGRKAIVFCPSREIADSLTKSLSDLKHLGEISRDEGLADIAWEAFSNNSRTISNVMITARLNITGIDIPNLTDIVLLRPIRKKSAFIDIVSRVTGKAEGKEVGHVWDFVDNKRHFDSSLGLITDETPASQAVDTAKVKSGNNNKEPSQIVQQFIAPVGDNVSKEDLLGRTRLLHVLKGLIQDIRNTRDFRPFVVGLFGKWGAGKSTVVCLLQKEFNNDNRFTFISFNAWQNEHCTHMGAALAHQVISQLYQKQGAIKKLWLALKQNLFLRRDKITAGLYIFGFLSLIASFSVQVDAVANVFEDKRWPAVLQHNSFASFFGVFLFLTAVAVYKTYWTHPFTDKIKKVVAKPDYSAHLGISEQIKEEIGALFKVHALSAYELWKKKDSTHQFVVVIDDLDRCSDAKIIEVLEAIRLIIDMQNVVVMLTVDQNILLSAVANKYSQQNKNYSWEQALALSRDFLGKIVQISIELDTPDAIQSRRFVAKRLYADTTDIETVHKHILSSREFSKAENKNASDVREMLDLSLKDMFGEDDDMQEDTASDIQTSNEYLKSTADEAETFSKCVGAFDIANPRTLVRIHNTITLLKGLHPELVSDKRELNLHIYLAFFHEVFAMRSKLEQAALEGLFHDSFARRDAYLTKLRRLGDQLEVRSTKKNIRTASKRIKRLSLPSVNNLAEIMAN